MAKNLENVYVVGFDKSHIAREKGENWSRFDMELRESAEGLKAMPINMPGNDFSFMFRDVDLASHFYEVLLEYRFKFPVNSFKFRKYALEEVPTTPSENDRIASITRKLS